MKDLEQRNILESTFRNILEEHKLIVTDGTNVNEIYLIEVDPGTTLLADFETTFPDMKGFKLDAARKSLGKDEGKQTYGVAIDTDLQYVFAFNRQFAEFANNKLVFTNPKDIILNNIEHGAKKKFDFDPKTNTGEGLTVTEEAVKFTHPSLVSKIMDYYADHRISIDYSTYLLVEFEHKTPTLRDLEGTYKEELSKDSFKKRVAEGKFGDKLETNTYGVLFDENLKMKFVFNTKFAEFEAVEGLVYQPLEELLLDNGRKAPQGSPLDSLEFDLPSPRPSRRRCFGGRACYALTGPKD